MSAARMHADEVDVDAGLVRALVAAQFPEWAALRLTPVEPRGTDNALLRLGDDLVARLPRTERTAVRLAKEVRWLPRLGPRLPLAVPVPVADGAPAAGYPFAWAVYRWLPGEPATVARPDPGPLAAVLAGFLHALWRLDPTGGPEPGAHNFGRGEALERRDAATRAALGSLAGTVDVAAAAAVWGAALAAPRLAASPVWIHGDLDARNVLVADGRLTAVLDFGGLGVGDPACDVMAAWKLLDAPARAAFREQLAIDDATWARGRGWAVSQAVIALAYYTEETNPTLVREARRWLAEALAG